MPYWRLSNFYLLFFALIGVLIPYWSLYLKSLGFGPAEIGELMAVLMATKIISPNIWAWFADRSGRHMRIVRLVMVLALVSFIGVFLGQGYWWMVAVMCLFGFFWNAALPQFETTTMSLLGDQVHRYSSIRLWGSVGFVVAVVTMGTLLETIGMVAIPWAILLLLMGLALAAWSVPAKKHLSKQIKAESIWQVLGQRHVLIILVACFLIQVSHGPYYTFYTIYLEEAGYSRNDIGLLWALGVVAEIGVFLVMHRLLPRFGVKNLLLWSLGLTAIRWVLIAWFIDSVPIVIFAQLLHAASFGLYHAVAIHLIHNLFTGNHQGRGQALYSSISFGAGGAVGALFSGYLWSEAGASLVFIIAAVISCAAFLLIRFGVNENKL